MALDPNIRSLRGRSENNRPDTPIAGINDTYIGNIELQCRQFAPRCCDETGRTIDNEELSDLVDMLMAHDFFISFDSKT